MADQPRDDAQERTEKATPRKLEQAREKGQVARSRELATTAVLLISAAGFAMTGPGVVRDVAAIMTSSFSRPYVHLDGESFLVGLFVEAIAAALKALGPFLLLVAVVAILASTALGGLTFSAEALGFKWEKLDPVRGMKRVFSANGLMELVKALAKFVVVTGATVLVLWLGMHEILSLNAQPLGTALPESARMITVSFLFLGLATLLVAMADVPFQLWNHARKMRMTRRQVKDELKDTEGKPEVKSRIRALQREVAQRRMMEAIPEADVVVTNPTHFAVALTYKAEKMQAPKLVAKGADLLAGRIREVAREHGVPIVEVPLLARAVYFNTRLGAEIPTGLYVAVAQVLVHVYRVRAWTGPGTPPPLDDTLPIPEELKR